MVDETSTQTATTTAADTKRQHAPIRWGWWLRRLCDGLSELLLLFALVGLTGALCVTVANTMPGIIPFEPATVGLIGILAAVPAITLAALFQMLATPPGPQLAFREILRATRGRLQRLVTHLGLIVTRRRALIFVLAGLAAGAVEFAAGTALAIGTDLPRAEAVADDARRAAIEDSPPWVPPAYFALYAAPWEELWYRGLLLLAFAALATLLPHPAMLRIAAAALLVATSAWFGYAHLDFSVLNAVTAGIGGLIYGGVALAFRSVWPAIVAHAVANALVGIAWAA